MRLLPACRPYRRIDMPDAFEFLSQGINGVVMGLLLSTIAVGFTLMLGVIGIINFAHGILFALGAYFAFTIKSLFGFWAALILSPIIVGIIGIIIERLAIKRMYGKDVLFCLLLTFGIAMSVEELIRMVWGKLGHSIAAPSFVSGSIDLGFMLYSKYRLLLAGLSALILFLVWLFLEKTSYGAVVKAGAQDSEMVGVLGNNINRLRTFVFGFGSALAGIAGVIAAPLWSVRPGMGNDAIMPAFVILVLGGVGSFWGTVIGGLAVGLSISLAVMFLPRVSDLVMYILAAVVLLFWPRGIMGEKSLLEE